MSFDRKLLDGLMVCPQSRSALVLDGDALVSVDPQCRYRYAISDGIPDMLVENAQAVPPDEWSQIMQRHGRDPVSGQPLTP